MGSLKDVVRDIMNEPWIPARKKAARKEKIKEGVKVDEAKPFCDPASSLPCITICKPSRGCDCGCDAVREALIREIAGRKLTGVTLGNAKLGCSGSCGYGPFLGFPQKRLFYTSVRPQDVPRIVEETVMNGRLLPDLLHIESGRSFRSDILFEKSSGLLGALDDGVCMVEAAKYFLDFEEGLTCAKCTPCRIGLKRLQEAMGRVVSGEAAVEELDEIRQLCRTMIDAPYCGFAAASSAPVLSALTHFEEEFRAHVEKMRCPAGTCEKHLSVDREERLKQKAEAAEKRRAEEAQRIAKAEKAEAAKKAKPAEPKPEKAEVTEKTEKPTPAEPQVAAKVEQPSMEVRVVEKPAVPAVMPPAGTKAVAHFAEPGKAGVPAETASEAAAQAEPQPETPVTPEPEVPPAPEGSAQADTTPLPEPAAEPEIAAAPPVDIPPVVEETAPPEVQKTAEEVGEPIGPDVDAKKAPQPGKPSGKAEKKEAKAAAPAPAKGSKGKSSGKKKKSGGKGKGSKN